MGRGRGGYAQIQTGYRDSAGNKVTDKNAIFVAERYIDMGYEAVFRREHQPVKSYDLTIKISNDESFVKNIEVKGVTSKNPSKVASRIKEGFLQFHDGENSTVAVFLPTHKNDQKGRAFAQAGFAEALRKGDVKGTVEVWFSDKTRIVMN